MMCEPFFMKFVFFAWNLSNLVSFFLGIQRPRSAFFGAILGCVGVFYTVMGWVLIKQGLLMYDWLYKLFFAFCKPRTWCSLVPGILQLSSSWGPGSSRKPVMSCLSAEEEIPRWVISSDVAVEIRSDWAKRLWFDLPNRNSLQKVEET